MNRIFFSLLLIIALCVSGFAQQNEALLTIGSHEIGMEEFKYVYNKNNSNLYDESDKKSPKDYLDLYINFKLKVVEAESLKMDTSATFKNELAGYRKEVAAPYLTDIQFNEKQVQELYRRMEHEVHASHILLRLEPNASEQQEAQVLQKINSIKAEIENGKDFGEAAQAYSEDPSAKSNKGDLGYFSAFMMVVPFEDAAFSTPVGEISDPIKSSFGYHIVKVHDLRKNRGEIEVAHIMKNIPQNATNDQKLKAKTEIDSIYQLLLNGADFAELARKESTDRKSAVQGGKMPWFSAGRIIAEFTEPAFALKNIGDITAPVQTPYGYHIIKKLNEKPIASFEDSKADIERRIKSDPLRSTSSKKAFVDKLKKEYNFTENTENKETLENQTVHDMNPDENLELFTIDGQQFGTAKFEAYLAKKNTQDFVLLHYDEWVNQEITELEDVKLETKYPEFRFLMQEYHDGILLFNISQDKIWNYASEDTLGLEQFYARQKKKHTWGERFKGYIITCKSAKVREEVENLFGEGLSAEEVEDHINAEEELVSIKDGAWEESKNPIVDYYVWNGNEPDDFDSSLTFVRGNKIGPEPKKLDEARGLYISDYQKYLEEKWIKELRSKHKVVVNKKLLKTIEGV